MPANRMNREEFFAKLAPLDEAALQKALWNLYWRGPAQLRERIEGEIEPAEKARRQRAAAQPPDARAEDSGPAEDALAQLIDLACETRDRDYFRSEDPMEAARFGALEGPERTLLEARLARRRGDQDGVHTLVREVLEELPGHQEALAFAAQTGAPLPARAAQAARERRRWDAMPE